MYLIIRVIFLFFLSGLLVANSYGETRFGSEIWAEYLEKNNLKETPEIIINALDDSNKAIRVYSASLIARLKLFEAESALVKAVEKESEIKTKIYYLYVLGKLGNEEAVSSLRQICDNNDDISILTYTATKLSYIQDYYCTDRLYDLYQFGSLTSIQKGKIISVLPVWNYKRLNTSNQEKVLEILLNAVHDESSDIRFGTINLLAAALEDKQELKKHIKYVLDKEDDPYRIGFLEYMMENPVPDFGNYNRVRSMERK